MRLSKRVREKLSEKLIYRANELYHDFENRMYNQRHADVLAEESGRWQAIALKYINRDSPVICLDYGTGTGFASKTVGPYLKAVDTLICCDLSQKILDVCKTDLSKLSFPFKMRFLKMDGRRIPLEDRSIDIVILNSVLHHLPDLLGFAAECSRVLKKGGLMIAAHEPNGDTRLPLVYRAAVGAVSLAFRPSSTIFFLVEKSSILEAALRKVLSVVSGPYKKRNAFLKEIAGILIREGLIDFKLRGTEIQQIVDIQTEKGFIKSDFLKVFGPFFTPVEWNTYNYNISASKLIRNRINAVLQKKFPEKGHKFWFVLKKT